MMSLFIWRVYGTLSIQGIESNILVQTKLILEFIHPTKQTDANRVPV